MRYFIRVFRDIPDVPDPNKFENSGENLDNSAQVPVILQLTMNRKSRTEIESTDGP